MLCPKCKSKTYVTDTRHNTDEGETYRYRTCAECGHKFYSVEFDVEENEGFKNQFKNTTRFKNTTKGTTSNE